MSIIRLLIAVMGLWTGLAVAPMQAFAHAQPVIHMQKMVHDDAHDHGSESIPFADACSIICSLACKFMLTAFMHDIADPVSAVAVVSAPAWSRVRDRDVPIPPPRHGVALI